MVWITPLSRDFLHKRRSGCARLSLQFFNRIAENPSSPEADDISISVIASMICLTVKDISHTGVILVDDRSLSEGGIFLCMDSGLLKT